eukprot:TRINITY_DN27216_c0_g1_i6.p1 TRINITY_DN27216_c0_g1~~TRINITY_DN27216_c0_g1_i6.p1  ORF type:complete len:230 (+),score=69.89 TRINITY_DN27216_c0_g1_i6:193-882(+)
MCIRDRVSTQSTGDWSEDSMGCGASLAVADDAAHTPEPVRRRQGSELSTGELEDGCVICYQPATKPVHLSCECQVLCCTICMLKWLSCAKDGATERSCPTCRRADVTVMDEHDHPVSDQEYQLGQRKVQQSAALEFEGEQGARLLCEAVDHFLNAISADPSNPKPYLGYAYLFILVDEGVEAYRYLRHVLMERMGPCDDDSMELAKTLLESITEQDKQMVLEEEKEAVS